MVIENNVVDILKQNITQKYCVGCGHLLVLDKESIEFVSFEIDTGKGYYNAFMVCPCGNKFLQKFRLNKHDWIRICFNDDCSHISYCDT